MKNYDRFVNVINAKFIQGLNCWIAVDFLKPMKLVTKVALLFLTVPHFDGQGQKKNPSQSVAIRHWYVTPFPAFHAFSE